MPEPIKIQTHTQDGLNRFIIQYKNSENLKKILSIFADRYQSLENMFFGLFYKLDIDNVEGILLDGIGSIIDQSRLGYNDETYRLLLKAKIDINVKGGVVENVISLFKILSNSNIIRVRDLVSASISLWGDVEIPEEKVELIYRIIDNILGAGIRIASFGVFDDTIPFIFAKEDGGTGTQGFADEFIPGSGGILGKEYDIITFYRPFLFSDTDEIGTRGFGVEERIGLGGILSIEDE